MKFLFLGPTSISGIGQVTRKYCNLVGGDFVEFGHEANGEWDVGFAFILPLDHLIDMMKVYSTKCKKMIYYTICETDPVNEDYGKLVKLTDTLWTSSQFCSDIFSKQFPTCKFPVLHLYAANPVHPPKMIQLPKAHYTFYHIGNVIDPRKNIHKLIECFFRAQIPNSLLILKATCHTPVHQKIPGVFIINDFLTPHEMESLHAQCDCYVSFSHSEGAGMGAVEAALRDKPVILQEYGGTVEYIKTPFVVPCSMVPVGVDDFLFKKDHMWGEPNIDMMVQYMKRVVSDDIRTWNHSHTKNLMSQVEQKIFTVMST